jgi:hypothetical protein
MAPSRLAEALYVASGRMGRELVQELADALHERQLQLTEQEIEFLRSGGIRWPS